MFPVASFPPQVSKEEDGTWLPKEAFMKRFSVVLAFCAFSLCGPAPARPAENPSGIRDVISRFLQSDWPTVHRAKWELESRQKEAVPELLALMDREDIVKLTNIFDLAYPGSVYYGHGYIVNYDLDYIPARAGWVLEELTFEEFDFRGSAMKESFSAQIYPIPEGGIPEPPQPTLAARQERFGPAIARAKEWWRAHAAGWSRLEALRSTLASDDVDRQYLVLGWLRYGTTRCDGLSPETYTKDLKPLAEKLVLSPSAKVRKQAELLLREGDAWWTRKMASELRDR
jgi:hypothetical protein